MTTAMLQKMVNEALEKGHCGVSCPVSINNRLSCTLGRAIFQRRCGRWINVRIEFSGDMIRRATEDSIKEVLLHECAHVIANYRTGNDEGHNATFKAVCHEIGTYNDKTYTKVEYKEGPEKPVLKAFSPYRYEILCQKCGVIGRFARACKTTKNIERYHCTCGDPRPLKVITNW